MNSSSPAAQRLNEPSDWVVEQAPGGTTEFSPNKIVINDKGGCSVWLKEKLKAPLKISYKAKVISAGGVNDRVSDLNCFCLASDPSHPAELFFEGNQRTGVFAQYDRLQTYYVGFGGNTNTTTRFRRYAGDGTKPLLPEHDLQAPKYLLEGNRSYLIEITADGKSIEFKRDGEVLFNWADPKPLSEGWFAFRTVSAHLEISDFKVESLQTQ